MGLQERVYQVLIVSASERFHTFWKELLPKSGFFPVCTVSSVSAAKRRLAEQAFDLVILNSPLPDEPGLRLAVDACAGPGTVVLLFVPSELYAETYDKVAAHGVFTLPKPTSRQTVVQALDWLTSARERLRKLEKKSRSVEKKMEEIRIVNRAKWLLISELHLDEAQAHRYIEKQAMDLCVSKRQVAEEIIKLYS